MQAQRSLWAGMRSMGKLGSVPGAVGQARPAQLFGNVHKYIDDNLRLDEQVYDVANLYASGGIMQAIARSSAFGSSTLAMIFLNAVYFGVDADHNPGASIRDMTIPFQCCEHGFCAFFLLEIMVRFLAFARKKDCLTDFWFIFDAFLSAYMLMDTYVLFLLFDSRNLGSFRLMRLFRLARFSRLMRASPELMTMFKAMSAGTRAAGSAILMLVLLIYVFAIAMNSLLKDEEAVHARFGDISKSMWTLLLEGLFMDGIGDLFRSLQKIEAYIAITVFMSFVVVSVFIVMNMLLGIFCEVVSEVAEAEQENAARGQLRDTLLHILRRLDTDGSGAIGKAELEVMIRDPEALMVLHDIQVDLDYFLQLQDMFLEHPDSELPIGFILDCLLKHRGERPACIQDISSAMNFLRWAFQQEMSLQTQVLQACVQRGPRRLSSRKINRNINADMGANKCMPKEIRVRTASDSSMLSSG